MTTQTVSSTRTSTTSSQPSLIKRTGMKAYRALVLMSEGAYKGYQAQRAPYYATV